MSRLDMLLLLAVIGCALSVVNSTYKQRHIFVELERSVAQQRRLAQDWSRLQYEQSALSKTSRIEQVAHSQLGMDAVSPARTQYLDRDTFAPVQIAPLPASAPTGARR
ncbi:cell division protein FtsL [Chitinasiproducens palmae]|uniref:Cell division protein FtsL n=1 Tax=Chitinasiproducens palmae TaxID=1770053 RepID=A0A1H2PRR0_9BURK|nr:cell division protein FtsL [Chitinasiproducens palmae]SDV49597.1 cell division protein FtsL [Chitinasiproducens palmae]